MAALVIPPKRSSYDDGTAPPTTHRLSFSPSLKPVLVFMLVSTFALPALFVLADRALPRTPLWNMLFTGTAISAVAVFAWATLRWEGVSAADVGFDRERLVTGVTAVGAVWFVINVVSYALLAVRGDRVALGLPASPSNGLPVGAPVGEVVGMAITLWVFVGVAEEFAFRGYFQNKVVALLDGGSDRVRTAIGVAASAALFALWHVPQMVAVRGLVGMELLPSLLAITIYTVVLGTLYELTRNVLFVGLLHGTFDLNPLFVVRPTGEPVTDFTVLVYPLAVVALLFYRRWATKARPTDFRPQTTGVASE